MVKVRVDDDVVVTGDFFMHPEEEVEAVEELLSEHVDDTVEEIEEGVRRYLDANDIELLGVSARDLAELTVEAGR